jgi:hypothetical protein
MSNPFGRPPAATAKTNVSVWLDVKLKKILETAARAENRSASAYVGMLVAEHFQKTRTKDQEAAIAA